jgi:YD repeat-containing protein
MSAEAQRILKATDAHRAAVAAALAAGEHVSPVVLLDYPDLVDRQLEQRPPLTLAVQEEDEPAPQPTVAEQLLERLTALLEVIERRPLEIHIHLPDPAAAVQMLEYDAEGRLKAVTRKAVPK